MILRPCHIKRAHLPSTPPGIQVLHTSPVCPQLLNCLSHTEAAWVLIMILGLILSMDKKNDYSLYGWKMDGWLTDGWFCGFVNEFLMKKRKKALVPISHAWDPNHKQWRGYINTDWSRRVYGYFYHCIMTPGLTGKWSSGGSLRWIRPTGPRKHYDLFNKPTGTIASMAACRQSGNVLLTETNTIPR